MKINKKRKAFTLVELIIVMVVIGLLAGLSVPKFTGIARDTKVAALHQDIDTLGKSVSVYYIKHGEYPIYPEVVQIEDDSPLLSAIQSNGETCQHLYKINLQLTKPYHSRLKYGNEKTEDDYFIYSKETGNIYYARGVLNGQNKVVYGYDLVSNQLKHVFLGSIPLKENKMTKVNNVKQTLTGKVSIDSVVEIKVNDEPVEVTYEEIAANSRILTNIYASKSGMKKFFADITLDTDKTNQIKITCNKETYVYQIKVSETADEDKKDYEDDYKGNYMDDINFSDYNRVIFVDANHGSDDTGTGTLENPFQTFNAAYEHITPDNNEAIYLKPGAYEISVDDKIIKPMSVIGEGKNTVLHLNHSLRRISNGYGSSSDGVMYNINHLKFYRLVFKSTITGSSNTFLTSNTEFHNVVFDVKNGSYSVLSAAKDPVKLMNCVDLNNIEKFLRGNAIVQDSYGRFGENYAKDIQKITTLTVDFVNLDENYQILDEGWQYSGTGTNRDGSQAHIGLYGGQYPWYK